MLKSEMEEKILSLELKLEEEEKARAFIEARLAVMLERVDEYDRLRPGAGEHPAGGNSH